MRDSTPAGLVRSLVLVIAAFAAPASAQPRNLSLQFLAPDANWTDRSVTGRAFICIQLKSETGLSEDCFGFYLRKSGKALVGGPGVVDKEFDFSKTPPARFVQVKASITTPITAARRQRLLAFIKGFDKDFSLTPANCITFANGVARLAGLKTPGSTSLTPVQYLNELRKLNPSSSSSVRTSDSVIPSFGVVFPTQPAPRQWSRAPWR